MACPAYGSSSEVSLWYTEDNDETTLWTDTLTWKSIPITGEAVDATLSSTVSEQITTARSYANSLLTSGEVTGSFNFEASPNTAFYDFLVAVLQDDTYAVSVAGTGTQWTNGLAIKNGSTKKCFAFMKRVKVATDYDWYIFRGVQIGSLSLEMSPGALMTGTCNLMGIKPEAPQEALPKPATWALTETTAVPLITAVGANQTIELRNSGGTSFGVTLQNVSLNFDNQLRQQQAIGTGNVFSAGIGSGRFMATLSASVYYQAPDIYAALLADTELKFFASLRNSSTHGIDILLDKIKVTSGGLPMAGGPDQDILISSEFQAFESAINGSAKITRVSA